jgi:hypothetical protein
LTEEANANTKADDGRARRGIERASRSTFLKNGGAASGVNPEGRFAEGIKNAASFYDKAANIIKNVVPGTPDAASARRRRRR